MWRGKPVAGHVPSCTFSEFAFCAHVGELESRESANLGIESWANRKQAHGAGVLSFWKTGHGGNAYYYCIRFAILYSGMYVELVTGAEGLLKSSRTSLLMLFCPTG